MNYAGIEIGVPSRATQVMIVLTVVRVMISSSAAAVQTNSTAARVTTLIALMGVKISPTIRSLTHRVMTDLSTRERATSASPTSQLIMGSMRSTLTA